jgi:hypothetical protein
MKRKGPHQFKTFFYFLYHLSSVLSLIITTHPWKSKDVRPTRIITVPIKLLTYNPLWTRSMITHLFYSPILFVDSFIRKTHVTFSIIFILSGTKLIIHLIKVF